MALFLDLFPRFNAPEVAQAAVDVLEANGFSVELPAASWSNPPVLWQGDADAARLHVAGVVAALEPYAKEGLPLLCLEPTAALCLREDFLSYSASPQARSVAAATREILDFLRELLRAGRLRTDFKPLEERLGYHQPCHHRALQIGLPALELLALIPGLRVEHVEAGCCGLAGSFGLSRRNYETSQALGAPLFQALSRPEIQGALSECSACRIQLSHGSSKPARHPLELLARASGGF